MPTAPTPKAPRDLTTSRRRIFARGELVDSVTGERTVLFDGPCSTAGEVVQSALDSARDLRSLGWVFAFIVHREVTLGRAAALWNIMHRKPRSGRSLPRWRELDGTERLEAWLGPAVDKLVEDENRARPRSKRAPQGSPHRIPVAPQVRPEDIPTPEPSPERELLMKQARALHGLMLARLRVRVHQEGTERDRHILPRWAAGIPASRIADELGVRPQAIQSFERKLKRWGIEELENLTKTCG